MKLYIPVSEKEMHVAQDIEWVKKREQLKKMESVLEKLEEDKS